MQTQPVYLPAAFNDGVGACKPQTQPIYLDMRRRSAVSISRLAFSPRLWQHTCESRGFPRRIVACEGGCHARVEASPRQLLLAVTVIRAIKARFRDLRYGMRGWCLHKRSHT